MKLKTDNVVYAKDWYKPGKKKAPASKRMVHAFEQAKVTRSEDLPQLLTLKEAAAFFKCSLDTVREWVGEKKLRSIKVMGRRFVTPEYIGEFLEQQMAEHG